jgi:hypothetical protein
MLFDSVLGFFNSCCHETEIYVNRTPHSSNTLDNVEFALTLNAKHYYNCYFIISGDNACKGTA